VGPALETTGVSCEDHFLEADTIYHSWQVIKDILELTQMPPYNDILCVIGAPVINRSVIYNSGVFIYNGQVILIKPKTILGNDGNYRESRWFTSYKGDITQNTIPLPSVISDFN